MGIKKIAIKLICFVFLVGVCLSSYGLYLILSKYQDHYHFSLSTLEKAKNNLVSAIVTDSLNHKSLKLPVNNNLKNDNKLKIIDLAINRVHKKLNHNLFKREEAKLLAEAKKLLNIKRNEVLIDYHSQLLADSNLADSNDEPIQEHWSTYEIKNEDSIKLNKFDDYTIPTSSWLAEFNGSKPKNNYIAQATQKSGRVFQGSNKQLVPERRLASLPLDSQSVRKNVNFGKDKEPKINKLLKPNDKRDNQDLVIYDYTKNSQKSFIQSVDMNKSGLAKKSGHSESMEYSLLSSSFNRGPDEGLKQILDTHMNSHMSSQFSSLTTLFSDQPLSSSVGMAIDRDRQTTYASTSPMVTQGFPKDMTNHIVPQRVSGHSSYMKIKISDADLMNRFHKVDYLSNFELLISFNDQRYRDEVDKGQSFSGGHITLESLLNIPLSIVAGTLSKATYYSTHVDFAMESGHTNYVVPMFRKEGMLDSLIKKSYKSEHNDAIGVHGHILVGLDTDYPVDVVVDSLDSNPLTVKPVKYYMDEFFNVLSNEKSLEARYILFLRVKVGQSILEYKNKDEGNYRKVIFVEENKIYFDSHSLVDLNQRKEFDSFEIFEEDYLIK